jgi:hypothetical protein
LFCSKDLKITVNTGNNTGLYDNSSLMMVKTHIIINDEEYEFTIIASKIEKFKKDIFIPDDKFRFELQTV